ncbi:hypothetical protein B0G73_11034 [Paraburkholderia sp. BL25I1N1]|nr:hypothetical protein B0G73_11034 [Paraburkholderia sp. BL25I1N1]
MDGRERDSVIALFAGKKMRPYGLSRSGLTHSSMGIDGNSLRHKTPVTAWRPGRATEPVRSIVPCPRLSIAGTPLRP